MFRHISGHPHIRSLCLKHTDEGIQNRKMRFTFTFTYTFYRFVFLPLHALNTNCEPEDDMK
jgi:hypothetical protein